jgi:hypothetical protein
VGDITKGLYDRLEPDATLAALLSTYSGNAAVFTTDPIPQDATLPYVVIRDLSEVTFDTKTSRGREVWHDVGCYAKDEGSAVLVESIKERVRALLHRYALTIANFTTVIAEVSGIVQADEDGVFGRIVTIRLIVEET